MRDSSRPREKNLINWIKALFFFIPSHNPKSISIDIKIFILFELQFLFLFSFFFVIWDNSIRFLCFQWTTFVYLSRDIGTCVCVKRERVRMMIIAPFFFSKSRKEYVTSGPAKKRRESLSLAVMSHTWKISNKNTYIFFFFQMSQINVFVRVFSTNVINIYCNCFSLSIFHSKKNLGLENEGYNILLNFFFTCILKYYR